MIFIGSHHGITVAFGNGPEVPIPGGAELKTIPWNSYETL